jgi:hypothetical protein
LLLLLLLLELELLLLLLLLLVKDCIATRQLALVYRRFRTAGGARLLP